MKGQELKTALESIGTYWEGMPSCQTLLSLVPYEAAPTVEEFLKLFTGPVDIDLAGERVWPMPQMPEIK
jgi:hypothetical protein